MPGVHYGMDSALAQLEGNDRSPVADKYTVEAKDAYTLHAAGTFGKFRLRAPALFCTFIIEFMLQTTLFSAFADNFQAYPLLAAMQGTVSAVSGNVGLQASSTNVRGLALGLFTPRDFVKGVWPETKAAFAVCTILGAFIAVFSCITYHLNLGGGFGYGGWQGAMAMGLATWVGLCLAVLTAGISGAAAPLLFKRCGFDPSVMAGPLETAFQDVVGGVAVLGLAGLIMKALVKKDCLGGGGWDDCVGYCCGLNDDGVCTGTDVTYLNDCLGLCLANATACGW
jgi:Mg/Co/Ni transporter MgtE